jgi:hypothetical protein
MPEDHWIFEDKGANAAFGPVVDITTTNADIINCYEDIFGQ